MASNEHEALQLSATHQHLKRQQVSLLDRIQRLEAQAEVKREAAESNVEEQLRDKEAIEAENAAALARLTQNEAMVRLRAAAVGVLRAVVAAIQQVAAINAVDEGQGGVAWGSGWRPAAAAEKHRPLPPAAGRCGRCGSASRSCRPRTARRWAW